jgi:IS30 family transposase
MLNHGISGEMPLCQYFKLSGYLPKRTDFIKIPDEELTYIESLINQRPRKCLGYKTPIEVASSYGVVALRG